MSKVSIIVPIFNSEKYIKECLNSLLNQTYKDIEIICVIDGCTDNSEIIVRDYQKKYSNIKAIIKENEGQYKARLTGMEYVKTEYIMFVDSDDWLELNAVEVLLDKMIKNKCDIVKGQIVKNINKREVIINSVDLDEYIGKKDFENKVYGKIISGYMYNSVCSQLIKTSVINIKKLKEDYNNIIMGEDLLMNISIYENANSILLTNSNIYHYRLNENSVTRMQDKKNMIKKINDTIKIYSLFFSKLKIWNMNFLKNRKLVSIRIIYEISQQLNVLVTSNKISDKDKIIIIKSILNNKNLEGIRKIINIEDIRNCNYNNKKDLINIYNKKINRYIIISKRIKYIVKGFIKLIIYR